MRRGQHKCRRRLILALGCALLGATLTTAVPAFAAPPERPWLRLTVQSVPSVLVPGSGEGAVELEASNLGDTTLQASAAHPVKLTLTLPAGWSWLSGGAAYHRLPQRGGVAQEKKEEAESKAHCKVEGLVASCEIQEALRPYEQWLLGAGRTAVPAGVSATDDVAGATATGGEGPGTPLSGAPQSHARPTRARRFVPVESPYPMAIAGLPRLVSLAASAALGSRGR